MFVPIRRDPPIFRESFSDTSALQKNVKYRGSASFSCVETKREINLVFAMKSIFISSANSDTDGSEMKWIELIENNKTFAASRLDFFFSLSCCSIIYLFWFLFIGLQCSNQL